jgi:hypothetical protein
MLSRRAPALLSAVLLLTYVPPTGTKVTESWKDPAAKDVQFDKIVAVAIAREPKFRQDAEDRMVATIGRDRAIASFGLFPDLKATDKDAALAKIKEAGCDGAVVIRPMGSKTKVSNIPGKIEYDPIYDTFVGYWGYAWTTSWAPEYQESDLTVKIQTLVYDLKSGKLIWSSTTDTKNPGSVRNLVDGIADKVGKSMRKQGLIR